MAQTESRRQRATPPPRPVVRQGRTATAPGARLLTRLASSRDSEVRRGVLGATNRLTQGVALRQHRSGSPIDALRRIPAVGVRWCGDPHLEHAPLHFTDASQQRFDLSGDVEQVTSTMSSSPSTGDFCRYPIIDRHRPFLAARGVVDRIHCHADATMVSSC